VSDDFPTEPAEAEARIALLRSLVAENPGDATTQFLLGRALLSHGHAAEAVSAFEAAIRADADYAAAYRQLGNAQEAAGRPGDAAATYRLGVEVAARTNDLQAGREMGAFLRRLARDGPRP
jgi:cytochrome c-type biogenesis protein CcmH/NrfG